MSEKKWWKLNELLNKIRQDDNMLKNAKIVGRLLGVLVDILYYVIIKRGK